MANEHQPFAQESISPTDDAGTLASSLKGKARDLGAKAANRAEQARVSAAAGLDTVAGTLHDTGEQVAGAAHSAANAVASSAEYLRGNDVRTVMNDVMAVFKRNPGITLLGAATLGFLLGRALARD